MYELIMVLLKSENGESVPKSFGYILKFYPVTVTALKKLWSNFSNEIALTDFLPSAYQSGNKQD